MIAITVIITVAVLVPIICVAAGPGIIGLVRQERERHQQESASRLRRAARRKKVHLSQAESEDLMKAS